MQKQERVNEHLRDELALLVSREIPVDCGLITITYVDCAPDLNNAKVGVSVLPFNLAGSALRALRKNTSFFSKELMKRLRIRKIPKFHWTIDDTENQAAKIEAIIKKIKEEENF